MKRTLTAFLLLIPVTTFAGADQPWNEIEYLGHGDAVVGLFGLVVVAFVVHLLEKGEFFGFLGDFGKGLVFIAGMYLVVFGFLASIFVVSIVFRGIGIDKSTAGVLAFPLGLVLGYKIYSFLIDAHERKKKDKE